MNENRMCKLTVHGLRIPVPATFGSGQAGSRSLISLGCRALVVNSLDTVVSNVASSFDKEVFKPSISLLEHP